VQAVGVQVLPKWSRLVHIPAVHHDLTSRCAQCAKPKPNLCCAKEGELRPPAVGTVHRRCALGIGCSTVAHIMSGARRGRPYPIRASAVRACRALHCTAQMEVGLATLHRCSEATACRHVLVMEYLHGPTLVDGVKASYTALARKLGRQPSRASRLSHRRCPDRGITAGPHALVTPGPHHGTGPGRASAMMERGARTVGILQRPNASRTIR
jgi:hypothetical protein